MSSKSRLRDVPAVRVPASASTLRGFRAWAASEEFPRHGRISYLQGSVFIDRSPEELETHNKVKTAVTSRLHLLAEELDVGEVYSDRTLLTHEAAGVSTEPDGIFVKWESLRSGRVLRVPRESRPEEYIELEGTPDLVFEVVSRNSVEKDTEILIRDYFVAGIPEYWLIDARADGIDFRILTAGEDGYTVARSRQGWLLSTVLEREFRLERCRNRIGSWRYTLVVKPV